MPLNHLKKTFLIHLDVSCHFPVLKRADFQKTYAVKKREFLGHGGKIKRMTPKTNC